MEKLLCLREQFQRLLISSQRLEETSLVDIGNDQIIWLPLLQAMFVSGVLKVHRAASS